MDKLTALFYLGFVGLILLVPFNRCLAGAEQNIQFDLLGVNDGLSQSSGFAILEDSQGFIWIGTQHGLNQYNGQTITSFFHDSADQKTLPSDYIWSIIEDANTDLWLATQGAGLVQWQRKTGTFKRTAIPPDLKGNSGEMGKAILSGGDGRIWLGTRGSGLLCFDSQGRFIRQYVIEPVDSKPENFGTIYDLLEVSPTKLLIGTMSGLYELDTETGQFLTPTEIGVSIFSLFKDSQATVWLGSFGHGLYRRRPGEESYQVFSHDPAQAGSLSNNFVMDILEDPDGRMWLATYGGLNLFDRATEQFRAFRPGDNEFKNLAGDQLMALHQGKDGVMWVGTQTNGVNRWNPRSWEFGKTSPAVLSGSAVFNFADSDGGKIWIATENSNLLEFDEKGIFQREFSPEFGLPERSQASAADLLTDSTGRLWIATLRHGIEVYLPKENRLDTLKHNSADPSSLRAGPVMVLFEDSLGRIWIGGNGAHGGYDSGLSSIDPVTYQSTQYLKNLSVYAIEEGVHGEIWVATNGQGLIQLNPETGTSRSFTHDPEKPQSISSNTIPSLYMADNGTLWISAYGSGLDSLEAASALEAEPVFKHLSTADGLSSNVINAILEDEQQRIWLSSNRGLMRLDPESGNSLRIFHEVHGAQAEEFNGGAALKRADGKLFFGAAGGYNAFYPSNIIENDPGPSIVITGIEVANQALNTAVPFAELKSVELTHRDDMLTIEYAALDFAAPEKNLYSVRLKGFNSDWSQPSKRALSSYTNLDAGEYTFQVLAANSYGVWSEEPVELKILVKAAPWETPLAYLIYFLIGSALIYGFIRWRMAVLANKERIRQLSYYDRRSGLPNLDLFTQRLNAALQLTADSQQTIIVISVRLKSLDRTSNSLASISREEIMGILAPRFTQQLFTSSQSNQSRDLARISETEIAAFLTVSDPDGEGSNWAHRLCDTATASITLAGHQISVSAFAGVSIFPSDGRTGEKLIEAASTAAYQQDKGKTENFTFYDSVMSSQVLDRLSLESDLQTAIRNNELVLYLQGKFNHGGVLVSAEALSRWDHKERGRISPGVFIPLAEESELIMELDEWVITEVWQTLHRWQQDDDCSVPIAVNVSSETFTSGRIFTVLEQLRDTLPINPRLLEIEITESVLASDLDKITVALERVKALGHGLSLDDFGTGYSSLTYVQRFPLEKLKIDQGFVRNVENKVDQQALCCAIVALAKSLGLETIAEGIENQPQQDYLLKLGCDLLQGFHLHRPEAIAEFETRYLEYIRRHQ